MPQTRDSYEYEASDTAIYKTNLYGGSHNDITNTERFTDDIDLSVYTGAEIDFLFTGSDATDDLTLTLYKRRDSSWTGNEIGWKSALTVANDGTETEYHYTIPDAYQPGHGRPVYELHGYFHYQSGGDIQTA